MPDMPRELNGIPLRWNTRMLLFTPYPELMRLQKLRSMWAGDWWSAAWDGYVNDLRTYAREGNLSKMYLGEFKS